MRAFAFAVGLGVTAYIVAIHADPLLIAVDVACDGLLLFLLLKSR